MGTSLRLFVALVPEAAALARLEAAAERVRALAPDAKWVASDNVHVTLAFLGQVEASRVPAIEAALVRASALQGPIAARLGGGGWFGSPRRPRVLWVDVAGDVGRIAKLHDDVARALAPIGYVPEERPFSPHLTLARARDEHGDPALARCAAELTGSDFGEWRIHEVVLFKSELSRGGSKYTVLARAELGCG